MILENNIFSQDPDKGKDFSVYERIIFFSFGSSSDGGHSMAISSMIYLTKVL